MSAEQAKAKRAKGVPKRLRNLRIIFSEEAETALVLDHYLFDGFIRFGVPEFYGTCAGSHFAVHQKLCWEEEEPRRKAGFHLEGDPSEVGIDYHGLLLMMGEDELAWRGSLQNLHDEPLNAAFHTILLDMTGAPQFVDDYGERTFLYTDAGWARVADLLDRTARPDAPASFRIGAAYRKKTVMWKVIARMDPKMERIMALAVDRGCAFAVDHPHWSRGLLASCRWGRVDAGETKQVTGKVYLLRGDLNTLQQRYIRDFKQKRPVG